MFLIQCLSYLILLTILLAEIRAYLNAYESRNLDFALSLQLFGTSDQVVQGRPPVPIIFESF